MFVFSTVLMAVVVSETPKAEAAPEGNDISWKMSGPGGGGWIQSIAWDPQKADVLYVGCDVGGFYYSSDAGRTFEIRNNGLRDYFLESIAVCPRDSRVILIGTESGIHRTTDQGKSWQSIRDGFPPLEGHRFSSPIGAVIFDPRRPDVAFAGIGRPRWRKDGAGAIYRSDNAGQTWRLISAGQLPGDAIVSDLKIQPGMGRAILAATSRGVFRSDDDGKTWRESSQGLTHTAVNELAFAPSSPNVVYCTLETTARDKEPFNGGVWRSDDGGRNWQSANGEGMPHRVGRRDQPLGMTSRMKEIVVSAKDPNVVFAGDASWVTAGVYRSDDGGKHWTRVTVRGKDATNMDYGWITMWGSHVECMAVSPVRPDRVAFGTSGHVFLTDDAGKTWQQRYAQTFDDGRFAGAGLEVTCAHCVVPDPVHADRLWYCYADIGLLCSEDGGRTFRRCHEGMAQSGNAFDLVVDPARPDTLWVASGQWATNRGNLCQSDDAGRTWRVLGLEKPGLPDARIKHLTLDVTSPVENRRLLAAIVGHGLFETRDAGRSWKCVNGNLPAEAAKNPRGFFLATNDPRQVTIALGGTPDKGAGIWATDNAGRTWTRRDLQSLFADITSFTVDPRNRDVMYVTARQKYDAAAKRLYPGGLFVSREGGRQWEQRLDFRFVTSVAVSPADSRVLYVGTTDHPFHDAYVAEGILKSTDSGRTWRHENTGMSHRGIAHLSIDPRDPSRIFACSSGNSVFIGRDSAVAKVK